MKLRKYIDTKLICGCLCSLAVGCIVGYKVGYGTIQDVYSNLKTSYDTQQEQLHEYENQINNTPLPVITSTPAASSANADGIKTQMQDYLDALAEVTDGVVLRTEAYSEQVYNMYISNDWYGVAENEKLQLAQNLYTACRTQYNALANNSGNISLTLYDMHGVVLAKSTLTKGMQIKK